MENELLKEVVAELKDINKSVKNLEHSVENLEKDVSEIKYVINQGVFQDITKLEKRVEALEKQKAG